MCNVKAKVTPTIIGATGTTSKSFKQYLGKILGKHEITSESANVKVQNIINMQNNITCSATYKYKTAATLRTLETMVSCRHMFLNTLHKGNNKYYDNNNNCNNNFKGKYWAIFGPKFSRPPEDLNYCGTMS